MAKVKIQGHASGTGILTVTAPDTDVNRTITLPDATGTLLNSDGSAASLTAIPAANITGTLPAIDGSSLTGIAGRRNIIINGAMKVAQRGTSFAAAATGTFPVDRFKFNHSSIGAYTVSQDSSAPDGFANSIKIDCTTADASPGAADHLYLATTIEGQDLQHLKKGTASAESVTLSFWVKSNKTANGQVNLRDMDNTRIIANTYTISSADTWEQKTITFAGDTTGAFGDDNGVGLNVDFWFDSGSNFSSGAMPTSWEATATADQNAGTTLALADSTSNYINITGVQLELGTAATDFEHRSYGEELALCQRYYHEIQTGFLSHYTGGFIFNLQFPVTMRATPSQTHSYSSVANDVYKLTTGATPTFVPDGIFMDVNGLKHGYDHDGGFTDADGYVTDWVFDAEL
jgi:hypothetical protein